MDCLTSLPAKVLHCLPYLLPYSETVKILPDHECTCERPPHRAKPTALPMSAHHTWYTHVSGPHQFMGQLQHNHSTVMLTGSRILGIWEIHCSELRKYLEFQVLWDSLTYLHVNMLLRQRLKQFVWWKYLNITYLLSSTRVEKWLNSSLESSSHINWVTWHRYTTRQTRLMWQVAAKWWVHVHCVWVCYTESCCSRGRFLSLKWVVHNVKICLFLCDFVAELLEGTSFMFCMICSYKFATYW